MSTTRGIALIVTQCESVVGKFIKNKFSIKRNGLIKIYEMLKEKKPLKLYPHITLINKRVYLMQSPNRKIIRLTLL